MTASHYLERSLGFVLFCFIQHTVVFFHVKLMKYFLIILLLWLPGYEHNCLYLLHKHTVMNLNVTLRVNHQDSINEEGFSSGNFSLD